MPASRSKRASRSAFVVNSGGRTLIATSRPQLRVARAVDVAHPAGAHQLHDVVRAKAIAALQRTAGHAVDGRPLGEAPRLLVRAQQRLDLGAQRSIVAAGRVEKRRPRVGALFERGLKHLLHAIPAAGVGRHACFLTGPVVIRR